MDPWVYLNGKVVPREEAHIHIYDHGFLYGDGVFDTCRVYGGRPFKLREHVDRLARSARALMISLPPGAEGTEKAVLELVKRNKVENGYIRISLSRGVGLGLDPKKFEEDGVPPTLVIATDELALYPEEAYTKGLEMVTVSTRVTMPQALDSRIKSLGHYVANIQAKIEANRVGAGEGLMLNVQGYVAEATGDNVFLVKDGGIVTPPPSAGILEGITRNTVIELARTKGYQLDEALLTLVDVYWADECFLTGTAAEVIPVVAVDGRPIGDGKPGLVTKDLMLAFHELTRIEGPAL